MFDIQAPFSVMVPSVSECPFRVFPSATPTPDTESTGGSISLNRLRTKGYKQCGEGFSLRRGFSPPTTFVPINSKKTAISDQESAQLLDAAGFKLRFEVRSFYSRDSASLGTGITPIRLKVKLPPIAQSALSASGFLPGGKISITNFPFRGIMV